MHDTICRSSKPEGLFQKNNQLLNPFPYTRNCQSAPGTVTRLEHILDDMKPCPSDEQLITTGAVGIFTLMTRDIPKINIV
jgi:hypothetical protein